MFYRAMAVRVVFKDDCGRWRNAVQADRLPHLIVKRLPRRRLYFSRFAAFVGASPTRHKHRC